jgi:hypothetical protein
VPSPGVLQARNSDGARIGSSRAIYFSRDFVDAGGLMGYGPNLVDAYRIALAEQAERIDDQKFPPRKEGRK